MTLEFNLGTVDNNGSPIISYELQSDQGLGTSNFVKVDSYPAVGAYQHTLTQASDGIVAGTVYEFRWLATNAIGSSATSQTLKVAAIDQLPGPASITKDRTLSSLTSIHIEWQTVTPGTSPGGEILGYKLLVEDANNGTSWVAFDGQELG